MNNDLTIGIRIKADSSGLVGEVSLSKKELDKLGAATGQAGKASDVATKASRRLAQEQKSLQSQFAGTRNQARLLLVGLGGFSAIRLFQGAVRDIGQFQLSMSSVQAVTQATDAQMAAMEQTARRLGATTVFSASEAAAGMEFLGRAGFNTTQIISAMPSVLNLAAAAKLQLGEAADIASNIMSAFNIEAERSGEISDVLAAAAASANTDVRQLGEAMKFVGPVAAAMNVEMFASAAAIGVLSNAGIQGSAAGTGLRRILSELASPSKAAMEALGELGITIDDVNPKTHDLTEIVQLLAERGITAAQAFEVFGDRGAPAILALTSQVSSLHQLTDSLADVEGTAQRMADVMQDNLQGDLKSLESVIEGVTLSVGDAGLAGGLRILIQDTTNVVRVLAGMDDQLGKNAERARNLARTIEFVGAAAGGFLALRLASGMLNIARATAVATTSWRALGFAMNATPIGIISTAIGLVVGLALAFRDTEAAADDYLSAQERVNEILSETAELTEDTTQASRDRRDALEAEKKELIDLSRAELAFAEAQLARFNQFGDQSDNTTPAFLAANQRVAMARAQVRMLQTPNSMFDGDFAFDEGGGRPPPLPPVPEAKRGTGFDGDDLQKLVEALDPAAKKARVFAESMTLLNAAYEAGEVEGDRYRELVIALIKEFPEAASAAGGYIGIMADGLTTLQTWDGFHETAALHEAELEIQRIKNTKATDEFIDSLEDELALAKLSETERQVELQTRALINQAKADGITLTDEEIARVRAQVAVNVEALHAIAQRRKAEEAAAQEWKRLWENAADQIQNTLADTFRDALDGNIRTWEDFGDSLLNIFKDIAAQIAAMLVFQPLVGGIAGSLGLGSGAGGSIGSLFGGGGGGGLSNLLSLGSSGLNLAGINPLAGLTSGLGASLFGLSGGASIPIAHALGVAPVAGGLHTLGTAGSLASGGLGGLTALAGPAALGALGGSLLAGLTGGNATGGGIGGGLGAALGFAVGGPLGALIGGAGGGFLGGMFGGGSSVGPAASQRISIAGGRASLGNSGTADGGQLNQVQAEANQAIVALNAFVDATGGLLDEAILPKLDRVLVTASLGGSLTRGADEVVKDFINAGGLIDTSGHDITLDEAIEALNKKIEEALEASQTEPLESAVLSISNEFETLARGAESLAATFMRAAGRLRSASEDLLLGDLSPLSSTERLSEARRIVDELAAQAADDNLAAIEALPDALRTQLELSRDVHASSAPFVADFNTAQALLSRFAGRAEELATAEIARAEELRTEKANELEAAAANSNEPVEVDAPELQKQIAGLSQQVATLSSQLADRDTAFEEVSTANFDLRRASNERAFDPGGGP